MATKVKQDWAERLAQRITEGMACAPCAGTGTIRVNDCFGPCPDCLGTGRGPKHPDHPVHKQRTLDAKEGEYRRALLAKVNRAIEPGVVRTGNETLLLELVQYLADKIAKAKGE